MIQSFFTGLYLIIAFLVWVAASLIEVVRTYKYHKKYNKEIKTSDISNAFWSSFGIGIMWLPCLIVLCFEAFASLVVKIMNRNSNK